jgi:hypothetical protein
MRKKLIVFWKRFWEKKVRGDQRNFGRKKYQVPNEFCKKNTRGDRRNFGGKNKRRPKELCVEKLKGTIGFFLCEESKAVQRNFVKKHIDPQTNFILKIS